MTNKADAEGNETPLTAPSSYLSYLPACYGEADADGGTPFVALYLKIFEKLLSGISDRQEIQDAKLDDVIANRAGVRELLNAGVIGNMFYPRWSFLFAGDTFKDLPASFTPPLSSDTDTKQQKAHFDELAGYFGIPVRADGSDTLTAIEAWIRNFFVWLGATIALKVDKNWPIDSSREIIGKTFAYDRSRGTPMGMEWMLNTYIEAYAAAGLSPFKDIKPTSLRVMDYVRSALIVRDTDAGGEAFHLRDSYPDPGSAGVISDAVGPQVKRDGITINDVNDKAPQGYVPRRFEIFITLPAEKVSEEEDTANAYYKVVQRAVDEIKPALSTYIVHFIFAGNSSKHAHSLSRISIA